MNSPVKAKIPPTKVTPLHLKRGDWSMGDWSNEEIVTGIIQRSPQAAQALCERYYARVLGRVRRFLGSDSECEDVVQQIFLSLIKTVESIREPALLNRWIDRTTVNAVRKEYRKRKRQWFISVVPELPETMTNTNESDFLFRRTAAVLETMHPDERAAFTLRFVAEEEIADIADMCNWSLSTTKRRIQKAREHFLQRAKRDPMLHPIMEGFING